MDKIKESMIAKGYTYLGCINGEPVFCNIESKDSIVKALDFLSSTTNSDWKVFKESTGNQNIVFYNTNDFRVDNTNLEFIGSKITLPLNCSSCRCMFANRDLRSLGSICLDTSGIVVWDRAFSESRLGGKFVLDNFCGESMRAMFLRCEFSDSFRLGFNLRVKQGSGMFAGSRLPFDKNIEDFSEYQDVVDWLRECNVSHLTAF